MTPVEKLQYRQLNYVRRSAQCLKKFVTRYFFSSGVSNRLKTPYQRNKHYPHIVGYIQELFPSYSQNEAVYLIMNDMTMRPRCSCGNELSFYKYSKGYSKYCSRSCSIKTRDRVSKMEEKMWKEFGVKNPFQVEKVKRKIRSSNLKKFGCDNPSQSDVVKAKKKETSLKNWGTPYPWQNPVISKKIGEYNRGKQPSEETLAKMRFSAIRRINRQGMLPCYNELSCRYFKEFDIDTRTNGQYGTNGGEYYVENLGYWLDYINHNLRLIIEWDEENHYPFGQLKEKDKKRQAAINEEFPEYTIVRIRQRDIIESGDSILVFFTKHQIHIVETLMASGILKKDY